MQNEVGKGIVSDGAKLIEDQFFSDIDNFFFVVAVVNVGPGDKD